MPFPKHRLPIPLRLHDPAHSGHSDPDSFPGVHFPLQARSRRTFEALLAAGYDLMAEGGIQAVTVQDVIEQAGAGAGSFYARFDSREVLIAYLHDRLWSDAERWWAAYLEPERWGRVSMPALVGEVSRVVVRTHFAREAELRAFWTRALARPAEGIMERTAEWDAAFVERFSALLLERRDAIGHPRPERAARLGAFHLLGTLRGHLFFPDSLSLRGGLSLPELALEMTRQLLGYLEAPNAPVTYRELLAASPRWAL